MSDAHNTPDMRWTTSFGVLFHELECHRMARFLWHRSQPCCGQAFRCLNGDRTHDLFRVGEAHYRCAMRQNAAFDTDRYHAISTGY